MDEQDMTEEEFLAAYNPGDWPRPSLTADICVFRRVAAQQAHAAADALSRQHWQLLLIERGGHPYRGCWALPGGFSELGEEIEETAERELAEETGLTDIPLERTYVYSGPGRDPRCWVATQVFLAVVDAAESAQAGDDVAQAVFFEVQVERSAERLSMRLVHGNETLSIDCATRPLPYTGTHRAFDVQGSGLAFDHARVIADAFLFLQDAASF